MSADIAGIDDITISNASAGGGQRIISGAKFANAIGAVTRAAGDDGGAECALAVGIDVVVGVAPGADSSRGINGTVGQSGSEEDARVVGEIIVRRAVTASSRVGINGAVGNDIRDGHANSIGNIKVARTNTASVT